MHATCRLLVSPEHVLATTAWLVSLNESYAPPSPKQSTVSDWLDICLTPGPSHMSMLASKGPFRTPIATTSSKMFLHSKTVCLVRPSVRFV